MPYYTGHGGFRGDYYRGDYYRGDPGLFSFIGKALGGVAKVASGFLTGGPGGAISAVGGLFSGASGPHYTPPPALLPPLPMNGGPRQYGLVNINRPLPPAMYDGGGGAMVAAGMACPKGHRINKSTYVTRGGGTSHWPMSLQVHPKGTTCVKARRMNVGNARALRRSLRRVAGFAKLVKRSKRAISRAASAVGVHRGGRTRHAARAPSVRIVKAA